MALTTRLPRRLPRRRQRGGRRGGGGGGGEKGGGREPVPPPAATRLARRRISGTSAPAATPVSVGSGVLIPRAHKTSSVQMISSAVAAKPASRALGQSLDSHRIALLFQIQMSLT